MNENTNLIEQVIKLVARTGLFFAKADGQYSEREQAFINEYIAQLAKDGSPDEVRALLGDVEHEHITLEGLVADTRAVLEQIPVNDADMVTLMLYAFINDVVKTDGEDCPAEKEALRQWCAALAKKENQD